MTKGKTLVTKRKTLMTEGKTSMPHIEKQKAALRAFFSISIFDEQHSFIRQEKHSIVLCDYICKFTISNLSRSGV